MTTCNCRTVTVYTVMRASAASIYCDDGGLHFPKSDSKYQEENVQVGEHSLSCDSYACSLRSESASVGMHRQLAAPRAGPLIIRGG
jgi:hypothetical protein